ncbi:MAG: HPF/RaiA family ribosome-associated protein [Bdellovibrionales bacterium]|nr:HPF/RaiA family ribosome-associated protein [Bdellovibrionales bacterium]
MEVPLEISFRDVPRSDGIDRLIHDRVERLRQRYPVLKSCRIAFEQPHRSQRSGNHYKVRIELSVPDDLLVVSHEHHDKVDFESMQVTVRRAFARGERLLREFTRRRRQDVKVHQSPAVGTIIELSDDGEGGMIEAPDGRRYLFNSRSLLDGARPKAGMQVSFSEPTDDRPSIARSVLPLATDT